MLSSSIIWITVFLAAVNAMYVPQMGRAERRNIWQGDACQRNSDCQNLGFGSYCDSGVCINGLGKRNLWSVCQSDAECYTLGFGSKCVVAVSKPKSPGFCYNFSESPVDDESDD